MPSGKVLPAPSEGHLSLGALHESLSPMPHYLAETSCLQSPVSSTSDLWYSSAHLPGSKSWATHPTALRSECICVFVFTCLVKVSVLLLGCEVLKKGECALLIHQLTHLLCCLKQHTFSENKFNRILLPRAKAGVSWRLVVCWGLQHLQTPSRPPICPQGRCTQPKRLWRKSPRRWWAPWLRLPQPKRQWSLKREQERITLQRKKKYKQKGKQALVANQRTKYLPAENRETKNQERPAPKKSRLWIIHHVLSVVPVSLFVQSRSNFINYFVNGNFSVTLERGTCTSFHF